jgi:thioredoxin 1
MANMVEITELNFEEKVLNSRTPVLIDFWAEWCGPCKSISPTLDELSKEYHGKMVFAKLNVDSNPRVAANLGVRSIPTLIVFKGGEEKERIIGAMPKNNIIRKIEPYLV